MDTKNENILLRLPKGSKIRQWRLNHCTSCALGKNTKCDYLYDCMRVEELEQLSWITEALIQIQK